MTPSSIASRSAARAHMSPRPVQSDRRSRGRLRDLCDEVIASHRAATGNELFSDSDREDARQLLASLSPTRAGR
ncbi:MAG: hypothetical protein JWO05_1412 [Gemmatimonadetes bacterium]|nr:hypothetical protein [Gemmatimonadota bacterium]